MSGSNGGMVAKCMIRNRSFVILLIHGSIVDFEYPKNVFQSGIVNAANEGCLGGGGVDGAISAAGGDTLLDCRIQLPTLDDGTNGRIRCYTGDAKRTSSSFSNHPTITNFGSLHVPHVIHAVGPQYTHVDSIEMGDELLKSAYSNTFQRAQEVPLEAIAIPLLSAGIFRGPCSLSHICHIAIQTICHEIPSYPELKEVHLYAFTRHEIHTLNDVALHLQQNGTLTSIQYY